MITLDSNIYISAFQFGGKPMALLELALAGEVQVAVSRPIIDETLRVLQDKFGWRQEGLEEALAVIGACSIVVSPTHTLKVAEDEPDNRILECAVESTSTYIVTGDGDLLRIGSFQGIKIVRVTQFLAVHRLA